MDFIVDRKLWSKGAPKEHVNLLYNSVSKKQCCLGFCAVQLGNDKESLDELGFPSYAFASGKMKADNILVSENGCDTLLTLEAVPINDSNILTDVERENALVSLFEKYGHTIKFIN